MRPFRTGKSFLKDERGNIALIGAAVMVAVAAGGALAVDGSSLYLNRNRLQLAADAAALAGVQYIGTQTGAATQAISLASKNVPSGYGTVLKSDDVVLGTYANKTFTATSVTPNALKVTTRMTAANGNAAPTFLGQMLGVSSVDITASAIAVRNGPTSCVYALNPSASDAFTVTGGGIVSVPHCGIQVNSTSTAAATATNNTQVKSQSITIAGNYTGSGWSPTPTTGQPALADPLASIAEPTMPATCTVSNVNSSSNQVLTPNVAYCGALKFTGSADVTMPAGIYYLKNAQLKVLNKSGLQGSGVMFFLDKDSTIEFSTTGTTNLSAPTSGTYQGILIFQSRSAPNTIVNKVAGSPTITLDGTIYTPTTQISMTGSGDISSTTKAGYLIADKFNYSGSVTFTFDTYSNNAPPLLASRGVLVN